MLLDAIITAKNKRDEISQISQELDEIVSDSNTENEIKKLENEIENLESDKNNSVENQKKNNELKNELQTKITELEMEILRLKDKVARNVRDQNKLDILKELKDQVEIYKNGRVQRSSDRLKDEILANYKKLLPNDNVSRIEIDNFIVKLINQNDE